MSDGEIDRQEGSDGLSAFEPKIIGFLCNWCSYAGADLAGVSRFQYAPSLRVIRVMCSGRIDPHIILESFIAGADGIFVGGCHPGDCHYLEGNYNAINKIDMTHELLAHAGIEPERLRLEWVSASEGDRFASVVNDFTEQIRQLGPSKLRGTEKDERLLTNLNGAERAVLGFRLRALAGREYNLKEHGNVYGDDVDEERLNAVISQAILQEYLRGVILELTAKKPSSVKDLAKYLHTPTHEVLDHVVALRKSNLIEQKSLEGITPLYSAIVYGEEDE